MADIEVAWTAMAVPDAILAERELRDALHAWSARWLVGHGDDCACEASARAMVEGGAVSFPELLVSPVRPRVVLVCSACLKTWVEGHDCGGQRGRDGDAAVG